MDPLAIVKALLDLGGWGAALATWVVAAVLLFRKGWVPGWIYDREREGREAANTRADRLTDAVKELTQEVRWDARDRTSSEHGRRSGA